MRCAVRERMGAGLAPGHRSWVDSLRSEGVEFVTIHDHETRPARRLVAEGIGAVLLAEAPTDAEVARVDTDVRRSSRHRIERELVRFARARRLPIVGIGQGANFLGLYFGGRLCRTSEALDADPFMDIRHLQDGQPAEARVRRAGPLLTDTQSFPDVLRAVAWNAHAHIAGFVHREEPILGLHWQPEASADETAQWISRVLRGPAASSAESLNSITGSPE